MYRVKSIKEIFRKLFAAFPVVQPEEYKGKTAGCAVKEYEDSSRNAPQGFQVAEFVQQYNQQDAECIIICAQKYSKQDAGKGNNKS